MENTQKNDAELLSEIYRNCEMSCETINSVIKKVSDGDLLRLLTELVMKSCDFSHEASNMMHERGIEPEELTVMKQKMVEAGIAMNLMMDASATHIAEMTARGMAMGACELAEIKSKLYPCDKYVSDLCDRVVDFEKKASERVSAFVSKEREEK